MGHLLSFILEMVSFLSLYTHYSDVERIKIIFLKSDILFKGLRVSIFKSNESLLVMYHSSKKDIEDDITSSLKQNSARCKIYVADFTLLYTPHWSFFRFTTQNGQGVC